MTVFHRRSLIKKIGELETRICHSSKKVWFVTENADGTYGDERYTEEEFKQRIAANNYDAVFIDDYLNKAD